MSTHSSSRQRTLPLSVGNVGFMLERLGQDCAPLQFLRELTQNSIEAILRTPQESGQIIWDVEWNKYDLEGTYKLALIDDGDGMTGEEMVHYINRLSSSIAEQTLEGNFGVGAKIAAATRNREGLAYFSWKNGESAMIHLWKDPDTSEYGLRQFQLPDGSYSHWAPVDDALKPDLINDHGTMVVLLGNSADEDTMRAPEGAPSPSRWIGRYLNSRYYRFPEGIQIRAREGWENPRSDTDRNLLRQLTGQREYLNVHAQASGTVTLSGAAAHWWILRDEPALSQNSGYIASNGHIAALYQDELYEMGTSRAGAARLQQFGVYFGYQRVVLYLEPSNADSCQITANTPRTLLLIDGEPLPWTEWASEFREKMPDEIRKLIEELAAGSISRDRQQAIRDRLKQIRDLFKLSRYRPSPRGEVFIDEAAPRRGGGSRASAQESDGSSRGGGKGSGGRAGDVYALFVKEKAGTPAELVRSDPFPEVQWISVAQGTRAENFLEDRAARYIDDTNVLQINADFRVFTDMVDRWAGFYKDVPGAREVADEVVREWFEQTLVETVLGIQSLEGAREWTPEHTRRATSEEGLTAAVMPRYHIDVSIRRTMGSKLGSLKDRKIS